MDEKKLRRYLGRLGDEAVPAPGFEDLSLQVVEVSPERAGSRRSLVLAVAAAVVVLAGVGLLARGGDGSATTVDAVGSFSSVVTGIPAPTATTMAGPMILGPAIGASLCEIDELVMLPDGDGSAPFMYSTELPEGPSVQITVTFRNESVGACVRPQSQSIRITDSAGNTHFSSNRSDGCDPLTLQCLIKPGETYSFGYVLAPSSVLVGSLTSLEPGTYQALVTLISRQEVEAGWGPVDPSMFDGIYERRTYIGEVTFEVPEGFEATSEPTTTTAVTTTTVATTSTVATSTTTTTAPPPVPFRMCTNNELVLLPNGAGSSVLVESDMVSITAVYKNESSSACTRPSRWFVEVWSNSGEYQQGFEDGLACIAAPPGCFVIGPGETNSATFVWDRTALDRETDTTSAAMSGGYNVSVAVAVFQTVTVDFEPIELPDGHSYESRYYTGMLYFEIP